MEYRREIDGLRAVAVMPVILFHGGVAGFGGGFVGVDVFFVISGYLITSLIAAQAASGRFSLLEFYERRARRILPALFFVVLASVPAAWLLMLPGEYRNFSQSVAAVAVFASNVLFWRESGYFQPNSEVKPLLHTWSLAVEEQYYVIFPILMLILWRFGRPWLVALLALVAAVSLGWAEWGSRHMAAVAFYSLPTRGWELLLGALIALLGLPDASRRMGRPAREILGAAGLLLIATAVFAFDESTRFPGLHALVPTIGAGLVIAAAAPDTAIGRVLGSPIFVGVGLISYSLYLWHQPLFAFAKLYALSEPGPLVLVSLIVATFGLAYLTWRYVEQPFRDRSRLTRRSIFVLAGVLSAILIGLGAAGHVANGFERRFSPDVLKMLEHKQDLSRPREIACLRALETSGRLEDACVLGAPGGEPTVVLVGDSHARTFVLAMDRVLAQKALAGRSYAYTDCPYLFVARSRNRSPEQNLCDRLSAQLYAAHDSPPKTYVFVSRWTLRLEQERFDNGEGGVEPGEREHFDTPDSGKLDYEGAMGAQYQQSIRRLLDGGNTVVLVYPVPEMGWRVPEYLAKTLRYHGRLKPETASTNYQAFQARNARTHAALDALGSHPRLIRIRPERLLCDTYVEGRCAAHVRGVPLYLDDDHLSALGSQLVAEQIAARLP